MIVMAPGANRSGHRHPWGAVCGLPAGRGHFRVTSDPFNPPANSLLVAMPHNRSTALLGAQTISDNAGGALTWVLRNDKLYDPPTTTRARLRVFCAPGRINATDRADRHQHQHAGPLRLSTVCLTGPTTIPTNFDPGRRAGQGSAGNVTSTFPTPPQPPAPS